jgi:F-type H+-transporting ATPase subunit delta
MSDTTPLARPYARAVFELARAAGDLQAWDDELALLAAIAADDRVRELVADPRIEREAKGRLLLEIAAGRLREGAANLVRLLAENGRLDVLPGIREAFALLKAETERRIVAQVISCHPVTTEQQQRLAAALRERLGCEVELDCSVDPSLLGGAVVRAGDRVIDGSVRGQL